jgi:hypothetical protein
MVVETTVERENIVACVNEREVFEVRPLMSMVGLEAHTHVAPSIDKGAIGRILLRGLSEMQKIPLLD